MKKIIAICVGVFLVIVAGLLFMMWAKKPSIGVIAPQPPAPEKTKSEPLDTAYFTALLPAGYNIKSKVESPNSQELLRIVATEPLTNGKQVAIIVGALPQGGLAGVATYNLRVKDPQTYPKVEFGGMPVGFETFSSTTNSTYQIAGFTVNKALYASITVSGTPASKTDINKDYVFILNNWQWR